MGIPAVFMGLIGITEGAIPFTVMILHPSCNHDWFCSWCWSVLFGTVLKVLRSHGGMIVAAATNNIASYTLDMAIGVAVGVAILVLTKPKLETTSNTERETHVPLVLDLKNRRERGRRDSTPTPFLLPRNTLWEGN